MKSREQRNKINREYRARNRESLKAARAANLGGRYRNLISRSRRLGRKFRISLARYKRMITAGCYYCSASLMNEIGGSLDRVNNNNRNYTTQNVVPCCTACNHIKSKHLNEDEALVAINAVQRYRDGDINKKHLNSIKAAKKKIYKKA